MTLINGPGEGSWSVFAEEVVAERDGLRDEVERLRALVEEACLFLDDSDKVSGRSKAVQLRHAIHTAN